MSTFNLKYWSSFGEKITEIRKQYGLLRNSTKEKNRILFRGQSNAEWKLTSTLERYSLSNNWSVNSYTKLVNLCAPEIESFTGRDFKLPEYWDLIRDFEKEYGHAHKSSFAFHMLIQSKLYDYWAYLRHHQFPSPLLDWSASPYVAAYFAFANPDKTSEEVSVYAYIERPYGQKGFEIEGTRIEVLHPYTKSHRRHFQQQSYYSVCYQPIPEKKDFLFSSHEDIFLEKQNFPDDKLGQDIFIKIRVLTRTGFKY
jgi:FRG domain